MWEKIIEHAAKIIISAIALDVVDDSKLARRRAYAEQERRRKEAESATKRKKGRIAGMTRRWRKGG